MDVAEFDLGENFDAGGVFEGLLRNKFGDGDVWSGEREQLGGVQGLHEGATHGLVKGFAIDVVGREMLLREGERGFAFAKAWKFNCLSETLQRCILGRLKIGVVERDFEFSLSFG